MIWKRDPGSLTLVLVLIREYGGVKNIRHSWGGGLAKVKEWKGGWGS